MSNKNVVLKSVSDVVRTLELDGLNEYKIQIESFLKRNDGRTLDRSDISDLVDLFDPNRKWIEKYGRFSKRGFNIINRRIRKALEILGESQVIKRGDCLREIYDELLNPISTLRSSLANEIGKELSPVDSIVNYNTLGENWIVKYSVINQLIFKADSIELCQFKHNINRIQLYIINPLESILVIHFNLTVIKLEVVINTNR